MAYIPRWRGEADIIPAGKVCGRETSVACVCLFLKVMAATRAPIWKDHEHNHEQDDFAPRPHTSCLEFDYISSSLALLDIVDTFPPS